MVLIGACACHTPHADNVLTVQNDYLRIIVNQGPQDMGHFSIETTNGEPNHPGDDHQPLIYGRPVPWTSFTSVWIDGTPYLMGGESKRLAKRSAVPLQFGVTTQRQQGQSLVTRSEFGSVSVIQTLQLIPHPSTRVPDSVLIEYLMTNRDTIAHSVGIRMVLDTMLGSNDGAPLRIGQQAITGETSIEYPALPFWQAFDSLTNPSIVAQGTLDIPDMGVYPPDQMTLANWGGLATHPWEYVTKPGRGFIREGENEADTALALLWRPLTLAPGESRRVRTVYGIGSLTRVLGDLALGLTAPLELSAHSKKTHTVVAYVSNAGAFDSQNTVLSFHLPAGLELVEGPSRSTPFRLNKGETRQLVWKIRARQPNPGLHLLTLKATSDTLQPNQLDRAIRIKGSVTPNVFITVPHEVTLGHHQVATVSVVLTNATSTPIEDIAVSITPRALSTPWFELTQKTVPYLGPGQRSRMEFIVYPSANATQPGELSVVVDSSGSRPMTFHRHIDFIHPSASIQIDASHPTLSVHAYGFIKVSALHTRHPMGRIELEGDAIRGVRLSVDPWVSQHPWASGNPPFELDGIVLPDGVIPSIFRWHFQAIKPGVVTLRVTNPDQSISTTHITVVAEDLQ